MYLKIISTFKEKTVLSHNANVCHKLDQLSENRELERYSTDRDWTYIETHMLYKLRNEIHRVFNQGIQFLHDAKNVLELGAGKGYALTELMTHFPQIKASSLSLVGTLNPDINDFACDIDNVDFSTIPMQDFIFSFSGATYFGLRQVDNVIGLISRLNPGGFMAVEVDTDMRNDIELMHHVLKDYGVIVEGHNMDLSNRPSLVVYARRLTTQPLITPAEFNQRLTKEALASPMENRLYYTSLTTNSEFNSLRNGSALLFMLATQIIARFHSGEYVNQFTDAELNPSFIKDFSEETLTMYYKAKTGIVAKLFRARSPEKSVFARAFHDIFEFSSIEKFVDDIQKKLR